MNIHTTAAIFREKARWALQAQDELFYCFRNLDNECIQQLNELDDVKLLQELLKRRIYPINTFSALVRLNLQKAIHVLIGLYLGKNVDPDTKFGGYSFELSSMLDDLFEVGAEQALIRLIKHKDFDRQRQFEPRFVSAVCNALSMDESMFPSWLEQSRHSDTAP